MDILDLTPGVTVLVDGHMRVVRRVVMHPAGPVVLWEPGEAHLPSRNSFDHLNFTGATIVPSVFDSVGTARERMAALL